VVSVVLSIVHTARLAGIWDDPIRERGALAATERVPEKAHQHAAVKKTETDRAVQLQHEAVALDGREG
jgi:hypothetical protein